MRPSASEAGRGKSRQWQAALYEYFTGQGESSEVLVMEMPRKNPQNSGVSAKEKKRLLYVRKKLALRP